MSREYAEKKIRDALKLCNGSMSLARQQIITLAQEDNELLKALVRPHIEGIVGYQVERVATGRAEKKETLPETPLSKNDEAFGMDILRAAVAQDVKVFGRDDFLHTPKRKCASKQHIDAIHKMASYRREGNKER